MQIDVAYWYTHTDTQMYGKMISPGVDVGDGVVPTAPVEVVVVVVAAALVDVVGEALVLEVGDALVLCRPCIDFQQQCEKSFVLCTDYTCVY
jgi:hypothetical protein